MTGPSEIEYRVAREQWHVEMAYAASCEIVASRHLEFARRCGDYNIAAVDIGTIEPKRETEFAVTKLSEVVALEPSRGFSDGVVFFQTNKVRAASA